MVCLAELGTLYKEMLAQIAAIVVLVASGRRGR